MNSKCISHLKMLSRVSRTYYREVALTSPIFWLFYWLQENFKVILSFLLGFRLVWAPSPMSYEAIIGSWSCWTIWTTFSPIPNWFVLPFFMRRWLFERIIFACPYSKLNDPSITQTHSWGNWTKGCCTSSWSRPASLVFFARRQLCGRTCCGAKDTIAATSPSVVLSTWTNLYHG